MYPDPQLVSLLELSYSTLGCLTRLRVSQRRRIHDVERQVWEWLGPLSPTKQKRGI